uniref:Uncharacterized protein n=1 Tax=Triticum urartu TaxID=4572 RepID=A0A8R7V3W0_TRIUA
MYKTFLEQCTRLWTRFICVDVCGWVAGYTIHSPCKVQSTPLRCLTSNGGFGVICTQGKGVKTIHVKSSYEMLICCASRIMDFRIIKWPVMQYNIPIVLKSSILQSVLQKMALALNMGHSKSICAGYI